MVTYRTDSKSSQVAQPHAIQRLKRSAKPSPVFLSDAQIKLLDAMGAYQEKNGIPPSSRELAGILGKSAQAVQKSLQCMVAHRLVTYRPGTARAYQLAREVFQNAKMARACFDYASGRKATDLPAAIKSAIDATK